jgi:hypothetical protein
MGPRTSLDILEKRKISCLSRIQIPDHPTHALITLHYHSYKIMLDFTDTSLIIAASRVALQMKVGYKQQVESKSGITYICKVLILSQVREMEDRKQRIEKYPVNNQIKYVFRLPGANSEIEYKGNANSQPVMNLFREVAFILKINVFWYAMLLDGRQLPFQKNLLPSSTG